MVQTYSVEEIPRRPVPTRRGCSPFYAITQTGFSRLMPRLRHSSNVHTFVQDNHGWDVSPEGEEVVDVGRSLTLQIRGTDVTNHVDAVELLERIGDSLMFQLDLSYDLGLTLGRENPGGTRLRYGSEKGAKRLSLCHQ